MWSCDLTLQWQRGFHKKHATPVYIPTQQKYQSKQSSILESHGYVPHVGLRKMLVYTGRGVYLGIQGYSWEYKGIQGYTVVYRGLLGYKGVFRGIQGYTRVCRVYRSKKATKKLY